MPKVKKVKTKKLKAKKKEEPAFAEGSGTAKEDSNAHTNTSVKSEKEELLALYQTLKDLGINSIGDLEVKISRL